jgi:hypothetical protein
VADPIITNIDIGSPVLNATSKVSHVLRNAAVSQQTFAEGTLIAVHTGDAKLYPYDPVGANGLNVPKYVLSYPITAAASSDNQAEVIAGGMLDTTRLKIHDGTVLTAAMLDQLRGRFELFTLRQLAKVDNPQP